MRREFQRWPVYRKVYTKAFDEMLKAREAAGKTNHNRLWTSGEGIFRWWIGEDQKQDVNQITIFDEWEEWL